MNDPRLGSSLEKGVRTWAEPSRLYSRVVLGIALIGPYRLDVHGLHSGREGRSIVTRGHLVAIPCVMLGRLAIINRGVFPNSGSI